MEFFVHNVLATAIFWSSAYGLLLSPWSTDGISVPFKRSSDTIVPINYRLPGNVVPNSYKIKLIPDLDSQQFTFRGISEINVSVQKPTRNITLHAEFLNIDDSIKLNCLREGNPIETFAINVSNKSIDDETDFFTIFLEEELLENFVCNLTLSYSSTDKSSRIGEGFYYNSYPENGAFKRIASTQFQAIYARRAFPCWDEPALKANFTISIEHKKKYVALSNMHIEKEEENLDDTTRTTTHFTESPRMSTYTVAFAIGDFATAIKDDTGNFRVWARKSIRENGKYTQDVGQKVLVLLENYLNSTYADQGFKKMDILAVPDLGIGKAMENWGLITFKESMLLLQDNSTLEEDTEEHTKLLAHELIHQWFGNLITSSWWGSIWLNEGFAAYLENVISDQLQPTWRVRDRFVTEVLQSVAFKKDSSRNGDRAMDREISGPINEANIFDAISYFKAACVIRMISHVLGEETFQSGLKRYITAHAFDIATSDNLSWNLADKNQTLHDFMSNWMNVAGYPVITVTRDYGTEIATISQSRYLEDYHKSSTERYYIPLNYATEATLDFDDTKVTHWFQPHYNSIEIDQLNKDQFVIFNKQQFGYYRVNYDEKNWKMIAKYMQHKKHINIHVVNRAQLIDDAFHFAKINQLKYNVALYLIGYLKNERDYLVWNVVWRAVENTYPFVRRTYYDKQFKNYILHLSEPLVDELLSIHLDEKDRLVRMSRDESLHWLCAFESSPCVSEATRKYNEWLDDLKKNQDIRVPPFWILCYGSQHDNQEVFDKLWENYLHKSSKEFFQALSCSSNQSTFERYLSELVTINIDSDFSTDFQEFLAAANGQNIDVLIDFIMNHYQEIIAIRAYSRSKLEIDLMALAGKINTGWQLSKLNEVIRLNEDSLTSLADEIRSTAYHTLRVLHERSYEFEMFFEEELQNVDNSNRNEDSESQPKYVLPDSIIKRLMRS